jgi:hypothetical protein
MARLVPLLCGPTDHGGGVIVVSTVISVVVMHTP